MKHGACSPVRDDCQKRAKNRPNPVDPVVRWEAAVDDRRSKGTGWIDAGYSNYMSVKVESRTKVVDEG